MNCESCGTFYEPGSNSPNLEEGCPNCGERPYREQPSPTISDMQLRDMPGIDAPNQSDTGGNPLQEGMLGGWKSPTVRDEAFASVRGSVIEASESEFPFYIGVASGPMSDKICRNCGTESVNLQNGLCPNCAGNGSHDTSNSVPPPGFQQAGAAGMNPFVPNANPTGPPEQGPPPGAAPEGAMAMPGMGDQTQAPCPQCGSPTQGGQCANCKTAAQYSIDQVIQPGPHTVEVDNASGDPIVMQHNDPGVLDAAKDKLKTAGLFSMLGTGIGAAFGGIPGAMMGHTVGGIVGDVMGAGGKALGASQNAAANEQSDMQGPAPTDNQGLIQPVQAGLSRMAKIAGGDYESPSSVPKREDTDDPEDVDPRELNDGTHDSWQKELNIDPDAGSSEDTNAGFDPMGHGMKMFEMVLPHLQELHDKGPGAGAEDPIVLMLDQLLEKEMPGYKDHPENSHDGLKNHILQHGRKQDEGAPMVKDEAGDKGQDDDQDGNDIHRETGDQPGAETDTGTDLPGTDFGKSDDACKHCGEKGDLGLGICPHCGGDQHGGHQESHESPLHTARKTAGGPNNPEQFKMLKDYLMANNRADEVPLMIDDPDAYTKEMVEIQGGQMPIEPNDGGLTQQPPAPPEAGDQPGAGMPMPPPPTGQQPMASVASRWNLVTPVHEAGMGTAVKCPKCNGHTTTILDNSSGESACHTCGHKFKAPISPSDGHSTHNTISAALKKAFEDSQQNPSHLDAADQGHPDQLHGDAASQSAWTDNAGAPLQQGSTYMVYSPKYQVPDRWLLTAVKPNAIEYQQVGEFGIPHATQVSKQEADMDGLQFVAVDAGDQELGPGGDGMEQNNDTNDQGDPNQQTDLSNSQDYRALSSVASRNLEPGINHGNPALDWLNGSDEGMEHTAGKDYTGFEQRQLINEPGVARNLSRLDLDNTHYQWDEGDDEDSFLW
jgi:hypothetical protein